MSLFYWAVMRFTAALQQNAITEKFLKLGWIWSCLEGAQFWRGEIKHVLVQWRYSNIKCQNNLLWLPIRSLDACHFLSRVPEPDTQHRNLLFQTFSGGLPVTVSDKLIRLNLSCTRLFVLGSASQLCVPPAYCYLCQEFKCGFPPSEFILLRAEVSYLSERREIREYLPLCTYLNTLLSPAQITPNVHGVTWHGSGPHLGRIWAASRASFCLSLHGVQWHTVHVSCVWVRWRDIFV